MLTPEDPAGGGGDAEGGGDSDAPGVLGGLPPHVNTDSAIFSTKLLYLT